MFLRRGRIARELGMLTASVNGITVDGACGQPAKRGQQASDPRALRTTSGYMTGQGMSQPRLRSADSENRSRLGLVPIDESRLVKELQGAFQDRLGLER